MLSVVACPAAYVAGAVDSVVMCLHIFSLWLNSARIWLKVSLTSLGCPYPDSTRVKFLVLVSSRCASWKCALKSINVFEWQVDNFRLWWIRGNLWCDWSSFRLWRWRGVENMGNGRGLHIQLSPQFCWKCCQPVWLGHNVSLWLLFQSCWDGSGKYFHRCWQGK